MASLRRVPRSPYWIACFTLPSGTRTQRSTKTSDRREAQRIANKYEDAARKAKKGKLVEAQARQVIKDIYEVVAEETLPSSTILDYSKEWLTKKEPEVSEKTLSRYGLVIQHFLELLGDRRGLDITRLSKRDISQHRDSIAKYASGNTINLHIKTLRAMLNQARKDGLIESNVAEQIDLVKRNESSKRPFTIPELQKILELANFEWRGMILFGLYTGLRISDLARLTWGNLDLESMEVSIKTQKTGRNQNLPISEPLQNYLSSYKTSGVGNAPLFPEINQVYLANTTNGALSKHFYRLLVQAGLAKPRIHKPTGKGGRVSHSTNELTFHSLRHTITTMLKQAQVSDGIVRDFVGHESAAVNKLYTHIDVETKRQAISKLPDVTAATP